jgi:hypothetical protein
VQWPVKLLEELLNPSLRVDVRHGSGVLSSNYSKDSHYTSLDVQEKSTQARNEFECRSLLHSGNL